MSRAESAVRNSSLSSATTDSADAVSLFLNSRFVCRIDPAGCFLKSRRSFDIGHANPFDRVCCSSRPASLTGAWSRLFNKYLVKLLLDEKPVNRQFTHRHTLNCSTETLDLFASRAYSAARAPAKLALLHNPIISVHANLAAVNLPTQTKY